MTHLSATQRIARTARFRLAAVVAVGLLAGCADEEGGDPVADTGISDTSTTDTSTADTSMTDTSPTDTSMADTPTTDTSVADVTADTTEADTTEADATCDPVAAAAEAFGAVDAVTTGTVEAEADGDGYTLTIDASAGGTAGSATNPYVYVDITDGTLVEITDTESFESGAWWLAFKRATIRTNSADSGGAGLMVQRVEGDFDTAAPDRAGDWATESFLDTDTCEVVETEGRDAPKTAFGIWYDYNPETHAVTPTEGIVYFIYEPSSHASYRIAITGWEDGVYTLRVAPL